MPPPWLLYESSSTIDYWGYWNTGVKRADYLRRSAAEHLPLPVRFCDWGCGPGRVIRHLVDDKSGTFTHLIGADYNEQSIRWCQDNISGAQFVVNDLRPPLPLPNASVDLLYGFSVFTHLSEQLCHEWLNDLARVVRPGGCILLTTAGDRFRPIFTPDERASYEAYGFVGRRASREGGRLYMGFHSPSYVRNRLAADLEVVLHDTGQSVEISSWQDVWLLRRPA